MSPEVTQAKAALSYSQDENRRAQTLLKEGSGTLEEAQQANSALIQKEAAFDAAQVALLQAKRQLAVLAAQHQAGEAQRAISQAQLDLADANLSHTVVVAPFGGRVTELSAAKGAYATPGQGLMLIVPLEVWVPPNFRETQLADMRSASPPKFASTPTADVFEATWTASRRAAEPPLAFCPPRTRLATASRSSSAWR
jgi:membrane fusion protein (multidrug efflux system)